MSGFNLKFKDVKLGAGNETTQKSGGEREKSPIAVIGMSCRFGSAADKHEYWRLLEQGKDDIRPFPIHREQVVKDYLKSQMSAEQVDGLAFHPKAYLDEIDRFDHGLFSLSPAEASLMDPNQRIFLETAWEAIEDAGYGGSKMSGTKTGVYVGYCNLSLDEYLRFIEQQDPSLFNISVPGNIKSIIASRISYLLDLKGPALMVDTACSSSLTAVHIACQAIWNDECEMAIAGGVKINLVPGFENEEEDIGIAADDGRTRTFDDSSNGTGGGEGSAAVLLKPLDQALRDGDAVYAVIKGTATNQDGRSIGITAPSASAQEDVLVRAWENAGIDPATLSYIEAHGTGTKLGDPVEIGGLERAFRRYTDKQQFCAIGSVKSNIGHLDGAAGMAGLIKAVLSLHHKQLPPTLHFETPNRKINFVESPVYINDTLREWETNGVPRRCGISSFGLSGTNAHVVLEEAPQQAHRAESAEHAELFTLSAKSKDGLTRLVNAYMGHLAVSKEQSLASLCCTANAGRGHYAYRLAILADDKEQLAARLLEIAANGLDAVDHPSVRYGEIRMRERTEEERRQFSAEADRILRGMTDRGDRSTLLQLADLYAKGAEVNWEHLYAGRKILKDHQPTYPFDRHSLWVEGKRPKRRHTENTWRPLHPLLDRNLVKSMDMEVYATVMSTDTHWELSEHVLGGHAVLPGTCYVEMALEVGRLHFGSARIELQQILFLTPLILNFGEKAEVHTILKSQGDAVELSIVSRVEGGGDWVKHVEGKIARAVQSTTAARFVDLDEVRTRAENRLTINNEVLADAYVKTGERWKNIHTLHIGEGEVLAELAFPQDKEHELDLYHVFPSLLDGAVNAANGSMHEGLYLPLHYEKARFYRPLPARFSSWLRKRAMTKQSDELATFEITLVDEQGQVIADIEGYTIKKFREFEERLNRMADRTNVYHRSIWVPEPLAAASVAASQHKSVLLFTDEGGLSQKLKQAYADRGVDVVEILPEDNTDYDMLAELVKERKITQVVHMWSLVEHPSHSSISGLEYALNLGTYSLFSLTKSLVNKKLHRDLDIVLVASNGYEVADQAEPVRAHHASMYGVGKVIGYEYDNLQVRCIDIDSATASETVIDELLSGKQNYLVAYRNGARYIEEFTEESLETWQNEPVTVRDKGVYVITGGAGGIGHEISKYLISLQNVRLAWFGRTQLPKRDEWDMFLNDGVHDKTSRIINNILELESTGSTVDYFSVDVADPSSLSEALERVRQHLGPIRGIVHSAGVAGDGFLIRKELKTFESVLKPKVHGTWLLHHMTEQDELDFFLMCSSLTSIFGAPGQSDYTAANAYQDAFSSYRNQLGKRTLTINWSGWFEAGMAVDHEIHKARSMFVPLRNAHAIEALDRVLQKRLPQMGIGSLDMEMFLASMPYFPLSLSKKLRSKLQAQVAADKEVAAAKATGEIVINGKDQVLLTATEKKVAGLWSEVLGLHELDISEKFFEIGGDSLLASRLLKELDKQFPKAMDITDVFIYSSVGEMAAFIDSKFGTPAPKAVPSAADIESDIDMLLKQVASGEISVGKTGK